MSVPNMGTLMTQKFNGKDGYIEQMGQKIPYEDDQKTEQKAHTGACQNTLGAGGSGVAVKFLSLIHI